MNARKVSGISVALLLAAVLPINIFLSGCKAQTKKPEPISRNEFMLGTDCMVKIYDSSDASILDKAFARIADLESKMSINKEGTEVDAVNAASGMSPVKVSADTFDVIERGVKYGEDSNGKFDITIGPLVKLWGINTDHARVPAKEELTEADKLISYKDIVLDKQNSTVFLKKKGMVLDLGGIAKGYVADQVGIVLKENGVKHAIINLGGNVLVLGNNVSGNPWRIGIQDPFNPRGDTIGILEVKDKTVTTSGIYERYFEQDGKSYHHILNPATGYPVDNEVAGVSIITDASMDGDALSTVLFCMGVQEGLKYVEGKKNIECIFVTRNKEVYVSSGLKGIFKLNSDQFKLMN